MNECKNIERIKQHIIELDNIQLNEARKITFKIPVNVKHCNGFMFSGNVPGKAANNYMLGNVSLFINNRRSHPLHYTIHSKPPGMQLRKNELLKLDDCLEGGSFIQGYYVDLGTVQSYPYTVKIYLETIISIEGNG